jgi:5-methylcytosine-specific restriction enzyme subunit McrC
VIRRTVLEWQSLPYGEGEGEIPLWAAERLEAVASRSLLGGEQGGRIITLGRKALRAGQVVGILAAEGVELEILPKIDVPGADGAATGQIRERLVHMLAVALDLEIDGGSMTELNWQREHLLEILIGLFTRKLAAAVRQGMPRQYLAQADDLRALRGRLDVVRQFSIHAANPSRLACRFDELSTDIPLNQIMKAAVHKLRGLARSPDNRRRLAELDFTYADVSVIPPSSLRWDAVAIDRTNSRWRQLLSLARFLLGDRFQTSSMGRQAGFSLLFEMNTLFEAYAGQLIKRALRGSDMTVHLQGGGLYCLESLHDGHRTFQTRPDILIKRDGAVVQIIDTKWKRVSNRIDDPKQGVSQADVYQMMAYGQVYGCPNLTLLYPHHGALGPADGIIGRHRVGERHATLEMATIAVSPSPANFPWIDRLVLGA